MIRFVFRFINRTQTSILVYWRASVASETLTGVTQSKIGGVCLFIGERDTLRGNAIEISLYLASERSE